MGVGCLQFGRAALARAEGHLDEELLRKRASENLPHRSTPFWTTLMPP